MQNLNYANDLRKKLEEDHFTENILKLFVLENRPHTAVCILASWNKVFSKILKKPIHGAEINDTLYESQADFHWDFFLKNPKTKYKIQKIVIFQLHKYPIYHLGFFFTI